MRVSRPVTWSSEVTHVYSINFCLDATLIINFLYSKFSFIVLRFLYYVILWFSCIRKLNVFLFVCFLMFYYFMCFACRIIHTSLYKNQWNKFIYLSELMWERLCFRKQYAMYCFQLFIKCNNVHCPRRPVIRSIPLTLSKHMSEQMLHSNVITHPRHLCWHVT